MKFSHLGFALSLLWMFNIPAEEPQPAAPFSLPPACFPVLTWELSPRAEEFADADRGLASVVDCQFTVACFVLPKQVPLLKKSGLLAMTCPAEWDIDWRHLSDAQIEQAVRTRIGESSSDPEVIGYFLEDEPGIVDFPALGKAVAAVKKYAPGKIAYINLFPDYATLGAPDRSQLGTENYTEYLERYVSEVNPQFISYDNYRVQYSNDLKETAITTGYFANLLEVRRIALKHDLPFWNIVASSRMSAEASIPSPANLLLQAYTTLAAGAKGLTWYTYYSGGYAYAPVDAQHHRTTTWSALKMVNSQVKILGPLLLPLKSTGVYFTPSQPFKSLPLLPGSLVEAVNSPTPMMVGEFAGAHGEHYAMLVNLSLEQSTRCVIQPRKVASQFSVISAVDASVTTLSPDRVLWLTAGQGMLLKVD